jgi:5-methylcytosine rRNA methyltransferase NSUN4
MSLFDDYYSKIYGDRWPAIRKAMAEDPKQGLFKNPFSLEIPGKLARFSKYSEKLWIKDPKDHFTPERDSAGLLDVYVLDPASVFVGQSLGAQEGEKILDMCAAPGGKSLVISSALGNAGELISNDLSDDRRLRMKKIFDQYIPAGIRERVHVKGWDAVQYGLKTPNEFDRVLLDAPCSGERHMMERPADLAEWKPKRGESLAQRQYALLCAALLAVKPGGVVVYSTCSINPVENDGVIAKLNKKKGEGFDLVPVPAPEGAEKTEFGVQFLPDVNGFGPMYCCKLRRAEKV